MGQESSIESSRHSSNGGYERLRMHNIQFAMLDMLRSPPEGFEDVVRTHFALRREHILATAQAWLDDATKSKAELTPVVEELRVQLAALPEVAPADVTDVKAAACGGCGAEAGDMPMPPSMTRADSA